jgi:phosphoserine phosphatase RsbU/P
VTPLSSSAPRGEITTEIKGTEMSPAAQPSRAPRPSIDLRDSWQRTNFALRRSGWYFRDGWRRFMNGMEVNELWGQFKTEATSSTRLYRQEVDWRTINKRHTWRQPFSILFSLIKGIFGKLTPVRRILVVISVTFAVLSLVGVEFLIFTQQLEFAIAFVALLVVLIMVLGDHVTMKRDIEIAREIQRWLVPRVPPVVDGIDMAFATRAANTVAGDYYDAFRRAGDGPLLIAVADVAGKSVPAAMLMANFQASLRALAGARSTLDELVNSLNKLACGNNLNGRRFTTAFIAELVPDTGELTYLSAGHHPPILLRVDGSIDRLKSESIPLGIDVNEKYVSGRTYLNEGDRLVIYTDGVTEARNGRGDEFGEQRLLRSLEQVERARSGFTLGAIMQSLDTFVGPAPQHDDITCLVVSRS